MVEKTKSFTAWNTIILVLSIYVLIELSLEIILTIPIEAQNILNMTDLIICGVFIFDWIFFLMKTDSKRLYIKKRFIDLIASIPFVSVLRVFRIVRVIRLVRILRLMRALKSINPITRFFLGNFARSALTLYLALTSIIFFYCALGLHNFEKGINSSINNFEDSVWMAFTTLTSVGYGDIYPVTGSGRILAAILVITGMGLFGLVTAEIAALIVKRYKTPNN